MLEMTAVRKNKINLADYNSQQDVDSRLLLSDFSVFDLEVVDEILFSPLKISIRKLSRTLGCAETDLDSILSRLAGCGLIELQGDSFQVDKDRRKYFEFQITRFEEDFKPDMEFLQNMLRLIPIHLLPVWYAIPRSSNNIFDSIIEKYFLTPQIYQRYLSEFTPTDPIMAGIIQDVFSAPEFRASSSDLIAKYNLARRDFDQIMLQLELNLICFVTYTREEDHWHESVTPFAEWRQYLLFLQETETPSLPADAPLIRRRESDFAFVEDMGAILALAKKKPIATDRWDGKGPLSPALVRTLSPHCRRIPFEKPEDLVYAQEYLSKVVQKLLLVKLADRIDGKLYALEGANDWIDLNLENRALNLYRHSLNRLLSDLPLANERNLREAEKSIRRVLNSGWVAFDDFIGGVLVPVNDSSVVLLKRVGKQWKYTLPQYSDEEKALIKATLFEWLFEVGMVATATLDGRDCFTATPFGQFFFED